MQKNRFVIFNCIDMNVLVLGSGGREHAIAWKIRQSENCGKLFCMPGNPGTAQIATNLEGSASDFETVKKAVLSNDIQMVVVGPEEPLVLGIRDFFAADAQLKDILFVGPCKKGAMLEGSKNFAKEFMDKYAIPTARYKSFSIDTLHEGEAFIDSLTAPYVLKADGLAAGKGVLILDSPDQAKAELRNMLSGKFGEASSTVVIEQFLSGIELSVFILTDGEEYLVLPEAKDYKRIGEEDTGLNTGGMGSVSPVSFADKAFMEKVEERIIRPTVSALKKEGMDYRGFIFIGLMNCGGDPYVIEYNVRMGDPETESVMTRIKSDFLQHLCATAKGRLKGEKIEIDDSCALTVVAVSGGYPQGYKKGYEITGSGNLYSCGSEGDIKIFHAGTTEKEGKIVTSGGRVLTVTVNGHDIGTCRQAAYGEMEKIHFTDIYFRRDIGLDLLK